MYSVSEIAKQCNGRLYGSPNLMVEAFMTDSRQQSIAPHTLFVALVTERTNAHRFLPDLKNKVKAFLVSSLPEDYLTWGEGFAFVVVNNTLSALQQLAAHHRSQFKIPVIGITGSNGKTVVKEWLYQLLQNDFTICRSPKSYNSQLGVPLSVLKLNATHTLALFEAGISKPNEMALLQTIIRPNIGVLTSFGEAHSEGFKNASQKLNEKLTLFSQTEKLVINGVEKNLLPVSLTQDALLIGVENATLQFNYTLREHETLLHLNTATDAFSLSIPFTDKAAIYNAVTCVGVLLQLGLNPKNYTERFKTLQAVALRLEVKNGIQQSIVINDFYNSDLNAIGIALDFLNQQHRKASKIAIVSDIEEHGPDKAVLYAQLQLLLQQANVDILIGVGSEISRHRSVFNTKAFFFESTSDFILQFPAHSSLFQNASILLKGARRYGFERISSLLQLKSHDTVLEINLNHLTHNVNYYRSLLKKETLLMGMVKATAYGNGSSEIATTLQHIGVNYLAVAYADEGVELRQANIHLPIMVMSPERDAWADIIQFQLEPEIYSFAILQQLLTHLSQQALHAPFPVHIKVDTGMHRLGFEPQDLDELLKHLTNTSLIRVQSVFSHLVASDNTELDAFSQHQLATFNAFALALEKQLGYTVIKHICNSGGISRFKTAHLDMVRLGIGMYGVGVSAQEQKQLQNVSRLRTSISQIKTVKAGDTVGYNRNGKALVDTRIATLPIGYADGFARALGNGRHAVYINGLACYTIGNICMDMCMVDISHVVCEEGDEVIIFETTEQLQRLAQHLNTIAYEVLTGISGRVKRVYVQE